MPLDGPSPAATEGRLAIVDPHIASILHRYATVLRRGADAEDLVQDTFARALRCAEQYVPGSNARAWLMTIMHNLHINSVRKGRRARAVICGLPDNFDEFLVGSDGARDALTRIELDEVLENLYVNRPGDFEIVMRVAGGGTSGELAARFGIPIGTVRSRLSRAREYLSLDR
jgi:RNA polymerase sigma-70 factor (ECF subfamily)